MVPAQEETNSVTVLTWTLDTIADAREFQDAMFDLGLNCSVQRVADGTPDGGLQLQVLIPDNRNSPVKVEKYGERVRTVTMDDALVSIEKLVA